MLEAALVSEVAECLDEHFLGEALREPPGEHASEADLREHRLNFFHMACRKTGARTLVQGHQADDVVETMLMRLARGSGLAGLLAPRPVRVFSKDDIWIVRPLLQLPKVTLFRAMRDVGLAWCEDASNASDTYLRNRIRHNVAPAWEAAHGMPVFAGVARARRLLAEDDDALESWVDALWPSIAPGDTPAGPVFSFQWHALKTLPASIHRRALWRVLNALNLLAPDASLLEAILAAIAAGQKGTWNIRSARLQYEEERLLIHRESSPPPRPMGTGILAEGSTLFWPGGTALTAHRTEISPALFSAIRSGHYSPAKTAFLACLAPVPTLTVRTWRTGDAYRPLGAPGTRKLSDMFGEKKISEMERQRLPVVCDGEGILWVPGLPPAARNSLTTQHRRALQLTWFEYLVTLATFFIFSSP
jgi:tRNA(Ile)-lysidine synthase